MSISLELLDRSSQNFVCRSHVVMTRSSSGGVAIRYVLPVFMDDVAFGRNGRDAGKGWRRSA